MRARTNQHRPDPSIRFAFAALFLVLSSVPAPAVDFYVNSTQDLGDTSPGDGACLTSQGTCTLRAAVEEVNFLSGFDRIFVPSGTFNIGGALPLGSDMTIDGNGPVATTISGPSLTRVLDVLGSSTVTLKDLEIADGWAIGFDGGLVDVASSATLTIQNCRLTNGAANNGGCIASDGTLFVSGTTLTGCHVSGYGGAIAVQGGTTSISAQSVVSNCTAADGGGVAQTGGTFHLEDSTVTNNQANSSSGKGGGLYLSSFPSGTNLHTIERVTVANNSAFDGGGIYHTDLYILEMSASTLSGNTAYRDGGGYYSERQTRSTSAWIVNVTVTGNSANRHGGGLYFQGTGSTNHSYLNNITVTMNTADADANQVGDGGGIALTTLPYLRLYNSVVAGNDDLSSSGSVNENPDCYGTIDSGKYSLLGVVSSQCVIASSTGMLTGTLAAPLDAKLGPATTCLSTSGHPLLGDSPARNSATPSGCTWPSAAPLTEDQCGQLRPFGTYCDMGAVEAQDTGGNHIFSDGFESGGLTAWSNY